jgi:hypothetical protein
VIFQDIELFQMEMVFPIGNGKSPFMKVILLSTCYGIAIAFGYCGGKDKWQ